jgi:hypothetical protein
MAFGNSSHVTHYHFTIMDLETREGESHPQTLGGNARLEIAVIKAITMKNISFSV